MQILIRSAADIDRLTFDVAPTPFADLITVVSVRGLKPHLAPASLIYVGRRCAGWAQSPLHNPIRLDNEAQRADVIARHKRYLWLQIQQGKPSIVGELSRIASIVRSGQAVQLGCWCKPDKACHGDTIKAAVLWWLKEST